MSASVSSWQFELSIPAAAFYEVWLITAPGPAGQLIP